MEHIIDRSKKIETVCFTGHRSIPKNSAIYLPQQLKSLLTELIEQGAYRFRAGGATGFDTVAALCVLELREKHPHIKLDLVLPCRDQTKNWGEMDKKVYEYVLSQAQTVEYVTDLYTPWCMHERNRRLVNGSQVCIAYLTKSNGGTAYTYAYALENGLEVINLGAESFR